METKRRLGHLCIAFVVAIHVAGAFYAVSVIQTENQKKQRFFDECDSVEGFVTGRSPRYECVRSDRSLISTLAL